MKIVCVGDCGIDHYLQNNEKLVGGISANFARHARKYFRPDDDVHLLSAVGNDDHAELVTRALAKTDVICHIERLEGETPVQYIELRESGERDFVRYAEGVLSDFRLGDEARLLVANSDLLVVPVYLQIADMFDDLISIPTRGLTSVDFADFAEHPDFGLIDRCRGNIDIGFFGISAENDTLISALQEYAGDNDKLFVVTLGPAGSIAFHKGDRYECAAIAVQRVVDTTGAGDSFAAGFLSCFCHGNDINESLRTGARHAAAVIQSQGAVPGGQVI